MKSLWGCILFLAAMGAYGQKISYNDLSNKPVAGTDYFANPMTTLGDMIYGGTSGAASRIAGPASGSVPYNLCSTPSGGSATAPAFCLPGIPGRTVTTTTDTILATDRGASITYNSATAVAVTLTSAAAIGNNFDFVLNDLGTGTVTFTPGAGTINGLSTWVVSQNESCAFNSPDNINYIARCGFSTITGSFFDLSNASTQTAAGPLALPAGSVTSTSLNFGTPGTGLTGNSTTVNINATGATRGSFTANGLHMGTALIAFGTAVGTDDVKFVRAAAGIVGVTAASGAANGTLQTGVIEQGIGTAVASATTIAPTAAFFHLTGAVAISTITPPAGMSSTVGGCLNWIADAASSTITGGNITTIMTFVAATPYRGCYDGTSWYIK